MGVFGSYLKDRNAYVFAGEPLVLHSHHYNCFLQKSIEQTREYIDIDTILINSAHEVVYAQFSNYFKSNTKLKEEDRKRVVEEYYSFCGFGKISLRGIFPKGGHTETKSEHYSVSWKNKFGAQSNKKSGVAFFTIGFLCGAVEAIFDIPLGTFSGKQTKCLGKGDDHCRFEIFRGLKKSLHASQGEGVYQRFEGLETPSGSSVNYDEIRTALLKMSLHGKQDTGLIEKFDSVLTWQYANYYCLVSIRILIELEKKHGNAGIQKAKALMIEAGKVCAFDMIGRFVLSKDAEAVLPPLKNQNDWVHAMVASVNAFGWGKWEVESLDPNGDSVFNVISGYESNSFLKMIGKSKEPICYFLEGCVLGIMNLVYHSDITQKPELNEEFFQKTFEAPGGFEVEETSSRVMGADKDQITARRV